MTTVQNYVLKRNKKNNLVSFIAGNISQLPPPVE